MFVFIKYVFGSFHTLNDLLNTLRRSKGQVKKGWTGRDGARRGEVGRDGTGRVGGAIWGRGGEKERASTDDINDSWL